MKFGEYLRANLTSEWMSQYIAYDDMKELLAEIISKAPVQSPTQSIEQINARQEHFLRADEDFFEYCEIEAIKVNTFFAEKLAEALRRFDVLKKELEEVGPLSNNGPFSFMENLLKNGPLKKRSRRMSDDMSLPIIENDTRRLTINNESRRRTGSMYLNRPMTKKHRFHNLNDFKLAFSEFYLMLVLLKNYQVLNYTGFIKILKKHDKLFETTRGNEWRMAYIEPTPFHTSSRVDQLINEVENVYTNVLESGDRTRAMQRLRVPPLSEKQPPSVTFRVGMFIGMLCLLIPLTIVLGVALFGPHSSETLDWRAGFHLYRSSFCLILLTIFFGINVYGWSSAGVNHVLIFEMDPRNHLTYQRFLEIGTLLMCIWFLSFNGFLIASYYDKYPFLQPFILSIFLILFMVNPIPILYRNSRYWFLRKLGRVILAPFFHVDFADFWLGDQLCSLELVFFDIESFFCFYIHNDHWRSSLPTDSVICGGWSEAVLQTLLICLPSWFRFAQCLRRYRDTKQKFPHLANAGKYATTFFAATTNALRRVKSFDYNDNKLENPFLYLWILMSLISSTYKVIWDLKMDWGFFTKTAGENRFLREQIVYPAKFYYYISIISNILFRYIWLINVFIHFHSLSAEYSDIVGFTFGLIEIFRRFVWNFYRLENEHLNNVGEYRAVRDISIRPTPMKNLNHTVRRSPPPPPPPTTTTTTTTRLPLMNNEPRSTKTRTSTDEIAMTIIDENRRLSTSPRMRRKTNAEEIMDEMDEILHFDSTNPQLEPQITRTRC